MHLGDVDNRRRQPGADGPNRLVGHDHRRARRFFRHRPGKLGTDHRQRTAGVALLARLAHADDRRQSRRDRGPGLGLDHLVGFTVVRAPFRMTDDDVARADVGQHRRREVAGMRAVGGGMAVLPADLDGRADGRDGKDIGQRRRRADEEVDLAAQAGVVTLENRAEGLGGGSRAVHLPVARHERARSFRRHPSCLRLRVD